MNGGVEEVEDDERWSIFFHIEFEFKFEGVGLVEEEEELFDEVSFGVTV